MARPTKYKAEFVEQAKKLCRHGLTDQELADFFDVNVATIQRWKLEHPEFCDAIKTGKADADDRVVDSLYHRAIGYQHDDVDIKAIEGQIVKTPTRKQYPPDTTAAIFWLKNRRPKDWRDKQEMEHSGSVTVEITRFGAPKSEAT